VPAIPFAKVLRRRMHRSANRSDPSGARNARNPRSTTMADSKPVETKHIVITRPVGVCDRGEKAEPAYRGDSPDFKLNKQGRAG
jgi:hypothetical protein